MRKGANERELHAHAAREVLHRLVEGQLERLGERVERRGVPGPVTLGHELSLIHILRSSASQIDDIIDEAKDRAARDERVLITTLTKKMAEDLTDHLLDQGVKARYMHSDIATLERCLLYTSRCV